MATLAKDTPRTYELGDLNDLPMVASDIIYEGAAVGMDSGYARPLTAGDLFQGFCTQKADNSSGNAGDLRVNVKTRGEIQLSIANLAITDIGKAIFASDDNTFVLTQSTNSYIGKVKRFVSTGVGVVAFDVLKGAQMAELTDSSTGTADGTIADVGAAFNQATLNNNFADLAAKVNALLRVQA
jgi:hypothetical protein